MLINEIAWQSILRSMLTEYGGYENLGEVRWRDHTEDGVHGAVLELALKVG